MGIGKSAASEEKEKSKAEAEKAKKVQFIEPELPKKNPKPIQVNSGRQIVPGLLIVSSESEGYTTPTKSVTTAKTLTSDTGDVNDKASSPSSTTSNQDSGIGENGVSPRDQLNYLGQLIGFSVSYSDFPKGNHSEFLSLVTLSTEPPHMSHGSGSNVSESRADAAMKALGVISELGLDNIKPKAK